MPLVNAVKRLAPVQDVGLAFARKTPASFRPLELDVVTGTSRMTKLTGPNVDGLEACC